MKHILLYTLFAALFFSCSDDEGQIVDNTPGTVRFQEIPREFVVSEASLTTMSFPFILNERSSNDVEVSYSITGDANAFELISTPNVITIPAGERRGEILIKPINDFITNSPLNSIVIEITGVSGNYELTESSLEGHLSKMITLSDDDCPLDLTAFVGTYTVDENNGEFEYDVTIEVNEDGDALLATNLFEVGGTNTLKLDNSDPANPVVSFVDGELLFNSAANGRVMIFNTDDYTSTFSTCFLTFDLYYRACIGSGACYGGFDGQVQRNQLTKQ